MNPYLNTGLCRRVKSLDFYVHADGGEWLNVTVCIALKYEMHYLFGSRKEDRFVHVRYQNQIRI